MDIWIRILIQETDPDPASQINTDRDLSDLQAEVKQYNICKASCQLPHQTSYDKLVSGEPWRKKSFFYSYLRYTKNINKEQSNL